jgi:hypothetical protein
MEMYAQAEALGSLKAKMRLAMLTGIPSTKASGEPDSPELIGKFDNAIKEIQKEFK